MTLRAVLLGVLAAACGPAFADCAADRIDLRGDWGRASFRVEIADDDAERGRGLMFREEMPRGQGMLFLYERPQSVSFWMRNTLIPLDMIFIAPDGRVSRVHENAVPLDETVIDGGSGVLAVLEINGGLSSSFGIGEGTEARHPALSGADAVWPCPVQ